MAEANGHHMVWLMAVDQAARRIAPQMVRPSDSHRQHQEPDLLSTHTELTTGRFAPIINL